MEDGVYPNWFTRIHRCCAARDTLKMRSMATRRSRFFIGHPYVVK
jgi:hypothetical protein